MTRLPALLAMILLLPVGCATTGNPTDPPTRDPSHPVDDSRVTLGLGETIQLSDDSRLSYTSLVNDSRCAPDVQCVWAGDAEIVMRWKPAHGSIQELHLHTNAQGGSTRARIGERTLTLVSLQRGIGPKATLSINTTP